ncbi:MAG: DegT/DnrJ/EryC1/StrS family aminotransferase [Treponemataceae bacterium]|nr:MAG: DegT/DnrJ/EryC1/StrS family aminotransferase [Treponemataceae bacterium]
MDAVLTCMVDEKIGPGELCKRLVQTAAEFLGAEAAFALRSPAIALKYALDALQIEKGAKIAISALAPSWHYYALVQNGFVPLVIDVRQEDAQLPTDALCDAVRLGAKAVLLFEALGFMPNMTELVERVSVPIIEDISQSAGAEYTGKKSGSFGTFSIMGMEEKDRITAGGGALLFTCQKRNSAPLKSALALSGNHACDLLPDINAALALTQIKEFAKNEERRRELHELFLKSLFSTRHKTFTHTSVTVDSATGAGDGGDAGNTNAIYGMSVILESGFKDARIYALKKEVEIELAFSDSVASLKAEELDGCENAKSLALRTVFFPLYPRLSGAQAAQVCKVISTLP